MDLILLEGSVLVGGQTEAVQSEVQQPSNDTGSSAGASNGFNLTGSMPLLLGYIVIIGALYYISMRPVKKREAAIREKQSKINVNDAVVTSSGMHGKVVNIDTDTFSIEFGSNKSVIIPVSKKDVYPLGFDVNEKETPEKTKDK